jgi:SPP1 family predicted phage head-tail adaptor
VRCVNKYNRKITVQQLSGSADAHGHIDNTDNSNWSTYTTAFAEVLSKGGREFWKVDRVEADVSHVWRCPYNSTLTAATPDMRLIHDSTTYEILSVIDIDLEHEEVEIQTRRAC